MDIAVVVCTYNRYESLKETLTSLLIQHFSFPIEYEIIIIDNNSTDLTRETVQVFCDKFPAKVKYYCEANQGKSFALNRGISVASAEILAFADDDVVLDKNWLENIYLTFKDYGCDGVGAKIKPLWLGSRPEWFSEELLGHIGILDYGDKLFEVISEKYQFCGSSVAYKKDLFNKYGMYNTNLGRMGEKPFGHEDSEVFSRFFANHAKLIYQPNATAFHKVPQNRLRKDFFRKYNFYSGLSYAQLVNSKNNKKIFLGAPFWVLNNFLKALQNFLKETMLMNFKKSFIYELRLIFYFGIFYQKIRERIVFLKPVY